MKFTTKTVVCYNDRELDLPEGSRVVAAERAQMDQGTCWVVLVLIPIDEPPET